MSTIIYNPEDIENLILQSGTIYTNVEDIIQTVDSTYNSIDSRISEKFSSIFDNITKTNDILKNDIDNIDTYKNWLTNTYQDYNETVSIVNAIADSAGNGINIDSSIDNSSSGAGDASLSDIAGMVGGIDGVIGGLGDADQTLEYYLDPEVWAELPANVKNSIETKLKALGFTDDEIKKIKDGEISVDKVKLDSLSSELEQALKADPTLRAKLLELYGFDIFNEDGTVNKDLLAIAMMMDDRDPNDNYDLQSLLKQLKISDIGSANNTTPTSTSSVSSISTSIKDAVNTDDSTTVHSGQSYSGANRNSNIDTSEIDDLLADSGTSESSFGDKLESLASSVLGGGRISPTGSTNVKQSSMGVAAAVAGVGSIATAVGGTVTKMNHSEEEKSEEDDEDEIFNDNLEQNNDKKDEELEIDILKKKKEQRDWLYGLGIGLGAAGVAAGLIDKNDDDENDNKVIDDFPENN